MDSQQRTQTSKVCNRCLTTKPIEKFSRKRDNRDGRKNTCSSCDALKTLERKENNRLKIKEYLGGEYICTKCGYTYHSLNVFDFHHIDPTNKDNIISQMLSYSWSNIKKELDKCVLLCACCHRIEHE